jgi:hypothetical protein
MAHDAVNGLHREILIAYHHEAVWVWRAAAARRCAGCFGTCGF